MFFDFDIFEGTKFKDLCKEVVNRSYYKKDQVDLLICEIKKHVKDQNDVLNLMPRIVDLLEIGIKNDEQLIKLSAVLQRFYSNKNEDGSGGSILTDEEKEQLLKEAKQIHSTVSANIPVTGSLE